MSPKRNVLFITYDGLTDPLGRSQILPYLIGLSVNYRISILSCEKATNFSNHEVEVQKLVDRSKISWKTIDYQATVPVWSPYRNYRKLLKAAKSWCDSNAFELVHCRSIIPAMVGRRLQQQFGSKLLFDIRGFWADERVDGKLWNLNNPIYKLLYTFFKKQEKAIYESADGIVSLTENAKHYIQSHYQTKRRFAVIPCAVDADHFSPQNIESGAKKDIMKSLKIIDDQYVLGYIGSLGTRYLLKEMLRFFKALKKQNEHALFLFVTKTPEEFIFEQSDQLGIDRSDIRITASDYSTIPDYINIMQASIFFITVGFSGKAVSPTKQSEVLSMGKPLIVNKGLGDTDSILKDNKLGLLVSSFEEAHLSVAAESLLNQSFDGEYIRNAAIEQFALKKAIRSYTAIYSNLLGG